MNTSKHYEYFAPDSVKDTIHIIGCGAIGSTVAVTLAKLGLTKLVLWDEDIVEDKNIANQMYRDKDVGREKTSALADILMEINPAIEYDLQAKPFYKGEMLKGYVFIAVDSIEIRKQIVNSNRFNPGIKAMFDFRMRLTDAQHYAADWSSVNMIDEFYQSMDFTDEEANEQTPQSACHETLSFFCTIMSIVSEGVSNFVEFCKDNTNLEKTILYNANFHSIDSFSRTDIG